MGVNNEDDIVLPVLEGAPPYFQKALAWQADLENERRRAYRLQVETLRALHDRSTDLATALKELRRDQARTASNLDAVRIEFSVLSKEVAAVGGRVSYQGDELHKLRTRVDQIERELNAMKLQLSHMEQRREASTVPPPSAAATLTE